MIKIIDSNIFDYEGADVVCHQVNCKGEMINGVALQMKERYPEVFEKYREAAEAAGFDARALLGTVCDVPVKWGGKKNVIVSNLFGQDNYTGSGFCFTDYGALRMCLERVKEKHGSKKIALPYRMSCSLYGGDWRMVEEIILDVLGGCDVTICRYKLPRE